MKKEKEILELNDRELEKVNGGLSPEEAEKIIAIKEGKYREATGRVHFLGKAVAGVVKVTEFAEKKDVEIR